MYLEEVKLFVFYIKQLSDLSKRDESKTHKRAEIR